MTLAQLIRTNRKKLGISQLELAEKLGVSQAAIGQWEREITAPRSKHLPELAKVFDINVEQVVAAAQELETYQKEQVRGREASDSATDNHLSSSLNRQQLAWGNSQLDNERIFLGMHGEESKRFESELFELLPMMGAPGRRHVRIDGESSGRVWIADYVSDRCVIEVKHPIRGGSLQTAIPQALWTLTMLRAVTKSNQNFIGIIRLPTFSLEQNHAELIERMKKTVDRFALEASLVGLKLRAVQTAEEAAKWIIDIEQEEGQDSE